MGKSNKSVQKLKNLLKRPLLSGPEGGKSNKTDMLSVLKVLRILRVLRPLRAINRAKGLKVKLFNDYF